MNGCSNEAHDGRDHNTAAAVSVAPKNKCLLILTLGKIYTINNNEIAMCEIKFSGGADDIAASRYDFNRQFTLPNQTLLRISIFAVLLALDMVYEQREQERNDLFMQYDTVCVSIKCKSAYQQITKLNGNNALVTRLNNRVLFLNKAGVAVKFVYVEGKKDDFYQDCDKKPWENEESIQSADGVMNSLNTITARRQAQATMLSAEVRKPYRKSKITHAQAEKLVENKKKKKNKKRNAADSSAQKKQDQGSAPPPPPMPTEVASGGTAEGADLAQEVSAAAASKVGDNDIKERMLQLLNLKVHQKKKEMSNKPTEGVDETKSEKSSQ